MAYRKLIPYLLFRILWKGRRKMNVPFSPPDISEEEIKGVVDTLQSGWITTGPKTKEFEKRIAAYCGTEFCDSVYGDDTALVWNRTGR